MYVRAMSKISSVSGNMFWNICQLRKMKFISACKCILSAFSDIPLSTCAYIDFDYPQFIHELISALIQIVEKYSSANVEIHTFNQVSCSYSSLFVLVYSLFKGNFKNNELIFSSFSFISFRASILV